MRLSAAYSANGSAAPSDVERCAPLTPDDFARKVAAGRPLVLRGACAGWNALRTWTPEHLMERVGDVEVRVSASESHVFGVNPRTDRRVASMPLRSYLRSFAEEPGGGQRHYLQKYPVRHFPALLGDFSTPACLVGRSLFETALWISRGGSVTPMHFDLTEGMLAQVRGVKRVILCEPVLAPLAPHPWHSRAPHFSGLPEQELEPERLRTRLRGRVQELELGPGDVLYIPSPWWHQVRSCSDFNVSINFWWLPRWGRMLRYWNHSLRSIQMEARRRILYGGGLPGEREAKGRTVVSDRSAHGR